MLKITEWAPEERPRERLAQQGAAALSNAELMAILLRTGSGGLTALDVARNLLAEADNSLNALLRMPVDRMKRVKGIGPAKAVTLCAAFELGRRGQASAKPVAPFTSARQVADLMGPLMRDLPHETCWVLYLDGGRNLISKEQVSSGGLNATWVDVRMILKSALDKRACELIVVHNHPSGNRMPSGQDDDLTKRIKSAAALFDIRVLDHLIVAGNEYFSYADEGRL